jgi:iron complex transport system substrate-binding protein
MGAGLGAKEKAEALAKEIEAALKSFKTSGIKRAAGGVRGGKGRSATHKKVLFIVWPEPLIVAGPGTAIDDAISLLGQENIAAGAKTTYPKYSIEEVIRQSPDVLFIGTAAGMDMRAVSQGILKRLTSAPAVRNGAVCYVSENLYRLGPRVVKGIGELEECLQ